MEGVKVFKDADFLEFGAISKSDRMKFLEQHLKKSLEGLVRHLFGDVVRSYFAKIKYLYTI